MLKEYPAGVYKTIENEKRNAADTFLEVWCSETLENSESGCEVVQSSNGDKGRAIPHS